MNKIYIAGLEYDIEYIKHYARDAEALGSHCGNSCTIKIDTDLKLQVQQKTLIHEILEAINFEYSLKLEHDKICVLESGLFEVIKNNPELLRYFNNKEIEKKDGIEKL